MSEPLAGAALTVCSSPSAVDCGFLDLNRRCCRAARADEAAGLGVTLGLFARERVELARLGRDEERGLDDVMIGHAAPPAARNDSRHRR
jgi:hypothetical protein